MKKVLDLKITLSIILLMFTTISILTSCKKEDKKNFPPELLLGDNDSVSVPNTGGTQSFAFLTNTSWKATSESDWINIINMEGNKGKDTIQFNIDQNLGDRRTGIITISLISADLSKKIVVIQESGKSNNFFVKEGKSGEGHSWENATSLNTALKEAASGDTIFIAEGVYHPSEIISTGNSSDKGDLTFEISKNIILIGGFPSNASKGSTSDPSNNKTIMSGDLGGGNASYHVISITASPIEGKMVAIEGVTVTDGSATGSGTVQANGIPIDRRYGGGINVGGSVVYLKDVDIVENEGTAYAAFYASVNADINFEGCKINDNISNGNGGGVNLNQSTAYLYNCEVKGNKAKAGDGIYAYPSSTVYLYNTIIAENISTSSGVGVYLRENSKGYFVNCLITGNKGPSTGGGIQLYDHCEATIISTTITRDTITKDGGGIKAYDNNNKISIYNSIISGNSQVSDGSDVAVEPNNDFIIKASISGSKVFDENGTELTSSTFDAETMLNDQFIPVGSSNPALVHGLDADALVNVSSSVGVSLKNEYIKSDMDGDSRTTKTVMGALLP